jgi:hypothetical protein
MLGVNVIFLAALCLKSTGIHVLPRLRIPYIMNTPVENMHDCLGTADLNNTLSIIYDLDGATLRHSLQ